MPMNAMKNTAELSKKAAGYAAANLVQDGMTVGLGTGSTAAFFISRLAERCKEGLKVHTVASSQKSWDLARQNHIPTLDINELTSLDLTVDGADEIDRQMRMIKGGGGALLREKIVASMSKEMIVIIDSHKLVDALGTFPLPVEVIPFAWRATLNHLQRCDFTGHLRLNADGSLYITDNGNYIYDIAFSSPPVNVEAIDCRLKSIPGVLETGFFFNLAKKMIIGYPDGQVEVLEAKSC